MSMVNLYVCCTFCTISTTLDSLEPIGQIVQEVQVALWNLLKLPVHAVS